jgi:hypothetical protein
MFEMREAKVVDQDFEVRAINYGNGIYRIMTTGNDPDVRLPYGMARFLEENPHLRITAVTETVADGFIIVTEQR